MKPVPFAQFLARQQQGATPAPREPVTWPQAVKMAETPEKPRPSPLLRQVEKPGPDPAAAAAQRLEQGRLRAFEDGREAARKEAEDELARLRDSVATQVAAARAQWAAEEGERLAAAHRAAYETFETRCAQAVANILRPFMTQLAIGRVTEALVENLELLFASRANALFEIAGPVDLLEALRQKFADREAAIVFKPDDRIDIRVRVDDTIIETQLGAWMQALGALPRASAKDPTDE